MNPNNLKIKNTTAAMAVGERLHVLKSKGYLYSRWDHAAVLFLVKLNKAKDGNVISLNPETQKYLLIDRVTIDNKLRWS